MSWREILGAPPSKKISNTQNSHNTQKAHETVTSSPLPAKQKMQPVLEDNCADIADSAYRDSEEKSILLEALSETCRGFDITPTEVMEALAPEDIEGWKNGEISSGALASFTKSLAQRRGMEKGRRPANYTERATCKHCGPVWLWFSGEVFGCPWCWNRINEKPIPRPCSVQCSDCIHFERIDHPNLGHCAKGEPESIAGLWVWGTDQRYCEHYKPVINRNGDRETGLIAVKDAKSKNSVTFLHDFVGRVMETLDLVEAAEFLKMHPQTVVKRVHSGEIPAAKPGKCWVFIKEDLIEWLRSQYYSPQQDVGQGGNKLCSLKEKTASTGGTDLPPQTAQQYADLLKLPTKGKPRS